MQFSGKEAKAQRGDKIQPLAARVRAHPRLQEIWKGGQEPSWSGWGQMEGTAKLPAPSLQSPHWLTQHTQLSAQRSTEKGKSGLLISWGKGMHSPARISGCFDRKSPPRLWVPPSHHLFLLAVPASGILIPILPKPHTLPHTPQNNLTPRGVPHVDCLCRAPASGGSRVLTWESVLSPAAAWTLSPGRH